MSQSKRQPNQRGRAPGLKGGAAGTAAFSADKRSEISKKAAQKRWKASDW